MWTGLVQVTHHFHVNYYVKYCMLTEFLCTALINYFVNSSVGYRLSTLSLFVPSEDTYL
jgi:hypothetical protein